MLFRSLFVADLGNTKKPNLAAPVQPLFTGHDAAYDPIGIVDGVVYLLTDRDAQRRRIVAAPLASPAVDRWRSVVPEGKSTIESADLVGGRLAVVTLEDVAGSSPSPWQCGPKPLSRRRGRPLSLG